jgi:hypothetical protein
MELPVVSWIKKTQRDINHVIQQDSAAALTAKTIKNLFKYVFCTHIMYICLLKGKISLLVYDRAKQKPMKSKLIIKPAVIFLVNRFRIMRGRACEEGNLDIGSSLFNMSG